MWKLNFFLNDSKPLTVAQFPVMPKSNLYKMVVGQERDAVEHAGKGSFDGSIARLLIYEGGMDDVKFKPKMNKLMEDV